MASSLGHWLHLQCTATEKFWGNATHFSIEDLFFSSFKTLFFILKLPFLAALYYLLNMVTATLEQAIGVNNK